MRQATDRGYGALGMSAVRQQLTFAADFLTSAESVWQIILKSGMPPGTHSLCERGYMATKPPYVLEVRQVC
jgi:hypothetical protein